MMPHLQPRAVQTHYLKIGLIQDRLRERKTGVLFKRVSGNGDWNIRHDFLLYHFTK